MKGGFQIIDLSGVTVGTQATIAGVYEKAAGNNTKPVVIITPDGQRVTAEIKAGTNKYVTAYLGADGATYTVEISNANKVDITQQPSDATTSAKVTALEDRANANKIGTSVNLTTYDGTTEGSDFYEVPKDGMLWVRCGNVATNRIQVNFKAPNNTTFDLAICGSTTGNTDVAYPVKKGWKLWTATNTGAANTNTAIYAPYDN